VIAPSLCGKSVGSKALKPQINRTKFRTGQEKWQNISWNYKQTGRGVRRYRARKEDFEAVTYINPGKQEKEDNVM
jgi:hypothetical protein